MRWTLRLTVLLLGSIASRGYGQGSLRLAGVIVDAHTRAPIPHCTLTLAMNRQGAFGHVGTGPKTPLTAESDDTGHFAFEGLGPANYQLGGSAIGYRQQMFEAHYNGFTGIALRETTPAPDLVFAMAHDATVSGMVVDEAGEPLRGARMMLRRHTTALDGRGQTGGQYAATNDLGRYEFDNLAAGAYELSLRATPWYGQPMGMTPPVGSPLDVTYPDQWWPGVTNHDQAEMLELKEGEERQADFHEITAPALRLKLEQQGQTKDGPAMNYTLSRVTPEGEVQGVTSGTRFEPGNGSGTTVTEFTGMSAGTYRLQRVGRNGEASSTQVLEVPANADRYVDASQARPVSELSVAIEGGSGRLQDYQVRLVDLDRNNTVYATWQSERRSLPGARSGLTIPTSLQPLQKDATLRAELSAGRYAVSLTGSTQAYVTELTAIGAKVSGHTLTIGDGQKAKLTLKLATGRGEITGLIQHGDAPASGVFVMLVPEDADARSEVRYDQSNTDGGYDLREVVPGRYVLLAVEHGWTINWKDETTLRQYLSRGTKVEIAGTEKEPAHRNVDALQP